MEFILTVIFYYAEPDRPPKVQRSQLSSYVECDHARLEAISKTPPGVQSVTAFEHGRDAGGAQDRIPGGRLGRDFFHRFRRAFTGFRQVLADGARLGLRELLEIRARDVV